MPQRRPYWIGHPGNVFDHPSSSEAAIDCEPQLVVTDNLLLRVDTSRLPR